jgi:hypothetical protein
MLAHCTLQRQLEESLYKILMPYIMQDGVQLDFRKGEYVYLATKISGAFGAREFHSVLDMVGTQSQLFEKELVSIFPKKSQPKVLLREFLDQSSTTRVKEKNYRVFFGYMIPKYSKAYNMDVSYLKATIGFKYGLMLLYQFIHFVTEVNKKGLRFGHLNFSNIYFLKNGLDKPQPKRKKSRSEGLFDTNRSPKSQGTLLGGDSFRGGVTNTSQRFALNLLFLEKNLMDLSKREASESFVEGEPFPDYKGKSLSQTTQEEQDTFTNRHLD